MRVKLTLLAILLMPLIAGADAVKAEYEGRLGNPEEPALRPYKGIWRGVKALVYCPLESLAEGNRKFPVLGTVEVFRGVRRGALEFVAGAGMGMAGSPPKDIRRRSKPNVLLESKSLAAGALDTATGALILGGSGNSDTVLKAAVGVCAAQQVVDRSPLGAPVRKTVVPSQEDEPIAASAMTSESRPASAGQTARADAGGGALRPGQ